jgi:hypothetical protein
MMTWLAQRLGRIQLCLPDSSESEESGLEHIYGRVPDERLEESVIA